MAYFIISLLFSGEIIDGALLVYDITDEESFKKVRTWVKELRRIVGEDIDITIAGNKVDLQRNRKVDEAEAKKYAQSVGATHFNTSAKLNRGLDDVFVDLTKRMLTRKSSKKKTSTLIADDEPSTFSNTQSSDIRNRDGGRGNAIQIIDDGVADSRNGRIHLRNGGGTGSVKKSGCC